MKRDKRKNNVIVMGINMEEKGMHIGDATTEFMKEKRNIKA